jgi:hypothetical protein
MVELFGPIGELYLSACQSCGLLNNQEIRSMRYRTSLSVAVLVMLVMLAGGIAGQTRKSRAKKRHARRTSQTTMVKESVPSPVEIPARVLTPPPVSAMPTSEDGVRRITPAEASEAVEKGKAIIVDVRGEESYNAGHVKGARLIPVNDILARISELPRDKMIITYCS